MRSAAADFAKANDSSPDAWDWLVWLSVYRAGPISQADIEQQVRSSPDQCQSALDRLLADGRIERQGEGAQATYTSARLEIPLGETQGWEAAVLDHFQAMVTAVVTKLRQGSTSANSRDLVGGSTWTLDVGKNHPLRERAVSTLARLRREIEELREQVDAHNAAHPDVEPQERVVIYVGQCVREA